MKTVYTCFCTDVIHEGHLNIINNALKYGELTVGALTDEASIRYNKLPTVSLEERIALYKSIPGVSRVVVQDRMHYDNIIKEPRWLVSEPFVRRMSNVPENTIFSLGYSVIDRLTSASTLNNVSKNAYLPGSYKPMDYVNELIGYLFSETTSGKSTNLWTREMQRRAVKNLITSWRGTLNDDQRPYALAALQKIRSRVSSASGDADTRAHYADLALQIKNALEGKGGQGGNTTINLSGVGL